MINYSTPTHKTNTRTLLCVIRKFLKTNNSTYNAILCYLKETSHEHIFRVYFYLISPLIKQGNHQHYQKKMIEISIFFLRNLAEIFPQEKNLKHMFTFTYPL